MGNNFISLNVDKRRFGGSAELRFLIVALRNVMRSLGYSEVAESVAETVLAVNTGGQSQWITIIDVDRSMAAESLEALSMQLSRSLHDAVLELVVEDSEPREIRFYRSGQLINAATVDPSSLLPAVDASEQWIQLVPVSQRTPELQVDIRTSENRARTLTQMLSLRTFVPSSIMRASDDSESVVWLTFVSNESSSEGLGFNKAVSALDIPAAFCGAPTEVRRAWRRLVTVALRSGGWTTPLENAMYIPFGALTAQIVVDDGAPVGTGKDILIWQLYSGIADVAEIGLNDVSVSPDRDVWYDRISLLVTTGSEYFWFCLGIISAGSTAFPMMQYRQIEVRSTYILILHNVLRWWPEICAVSHKFSNGFFKVDWPEWGDTIFSMCDELGISPERVEELRTMKCEAAGDALRSLLRSL